MTSDHSKATVLPLQKGEDLFCIVGFPKVADHSVLSACENSPLAKLKKFISIPSSAEDKRYTSAYLDSVLKAIYQYIIRKEGTFSADEPHGSPGEHREDAKCTIYSPRTISIAYSPAPTSRVIIEMFASFARCLPLRAGEDAPEDWWKRPDLAPSIVLDNIKNAPEFKPLKRTDARLLPFTNFTMPDRAPIWEHYLRAIVESGEIAFNERAVPGKKLFIGGGKKLVFIDDRKLCFPSSINTGNHALPRRLESDQDAKKVIQLLQQLYRFGLPIEHGYHFDVQHPGGEHLDRVRFVCCEEGELTVSGTHVNIYPNDKVRAVG